VSSISYSDGTPTKNFLYDTSAVWGETQTFLKGRLSKAVVAALGNYEGDIFSYDRMGRIVFAGQCFAYGCGNGADDKYNSDSYDWVGNLTGETDPTNLTISYTYNPANQVTAIASSNMAAGNPTQLISNVQNGPNGPVSYQQGNGLGDFRTYDGLGRNDGKWVCRGTSPSYHCETGSEPQIYGTELAWSGNQVTANCDTVINSCRNFGYDEFGRVKSQSVNSQTQYSYVYDRYGNRWQQNALQGGPSPSVAYNKGTNQIVGDSYDAAGNMTSDGLHTYTYDPEGNVTAVDGGSTASYTYDALNRRVRVANATNTVDYQFDAAGRRTVEWQENANFGIRGNAYWGNTPVAFHGLNGTEYFDEQDWLGTERVRTDYTGSVVGSYASLTFGDGFSVSGTDEDPHHFAGMDRDNESATDHAQFRQYSEAMGQWMSPDPYDGSYDWSDPQSYSRYAYAGNNPLAFVDSTGLYCESFTANNSQQACFVSADDDGLTPNEIYDGYGMEYVPPKIRLNIPVVAPNNGPTRSGCLGQALKSDGNGASVALDVLGIGAGFLPGGGLVTGSARAASFAFGAQVGLTAASTGVSIAYKSGPGIVGGILGGQVALTGKAAEALGEETLLAVGKSIPIVGVAVSTGALLYDGYQTYKAYSGCLSGVHE
jgi:RHS repeat-associated protein